LEMFKIPKPVCVDRQTQANSIEYNSTLAVWVVMTKRKSCDAGGCE